MVYTVTFAHYGNDLFDRRSLILIKCSRSYSLICAKLGEEILYKLGDLNDRSCACVYKGSTLEGICNDENSFL